MAKPLFSNGYIYVIGNQELTKIGITTDLKRRMNELKPDQIYVTAWIPQYEKLERKLHARYSNKRIPQTEYFRLSEFQISELVSEIKKIEEKEKAKVSQSSGKTETMEENVHSIALSMAKAEAEKVAKEKAYEDYSANLSWMQRAFGDHGERSESFLSWYRDRSHLYQSEEVFQQKYKEGEALYIRCLNIAANRDKKESKKRRKRY